MRLGLARQERRHLFPAGMMISGGIPSFFAAAAPPSLAMGRFKRFALACILTGLRGPLFFFFLAKKSDGFGEFGPKSGEQIPRYRRSMTPVPPKPAFKQNPPAMRHLANNAALN